MKKQKNISAQIIKYKFLIIVAFILGSLSTTKGQITDSISIEKCFSMGIENSTTSKQKTSLDLITDENIKIVATGHMPQAELNGQATYQTEVTSIPISIPGKDPLSKDQYKATIDLRQVIFDGGYVKRQKQIFVSGLYVEKIKLDVDIQQLKERISGIYLSILLINQNIEIVQLLQKDIASNIEKLTSMVKNGIALKNNIDILEAENLKTDQKIIELIANKKNLLGMLSVLVGKNITETTSFVLPNIITSTNDSLSNRAEYKLFEAQKEQLKSQSLLIETKNMPKVFLFATAGYGRPGLNMLSNNFDVFGIAGVKLTVPITSRLSTTHEKKVFIHQQSIIDAKREDFARNNQIQLTQQTNEIEKYKLLIEKDLAIVALRADIKNVAAAKLANGMITSNDFITELNAENQAQLNLKLHEIQLLQATINYNLYTGNI